MKLILVLILQLLPLMASADYLVKGVGSLYCERYVSDYRHTRVARQVHRSWILGFISGMNFNDREIRYRGEGLYAEKIDDWIINYCKEHPQEKLHAAVESYSVELEKQMTDAP